MDCSIDVFKTPEGVELRFGDGKKVRATESLPIECARQLLSALQAVVSGRRQQATAGEKAYKKGWNKAPKM